MSAGSESLAKRHGLYLLGFGGLFSLIFVLLASRIFQTGTYLFRAFLEKCLAICSRLMTLGFSALDGVELFAVLALTGLLLFALARSLSQARKVRAFSRSLKRVGISPRLHRLLRESALSLQEVFLFPSRLSFACTAGLFSPRIFVSTNLVESLSDEEVKAVLRHEQSHLKRRDPLRGVIIFFFGQFFIFLPRARQLLKGLRRDSELIADRHALLVASSPADLASALIKTRRRNLVVAENLPGFAGDDLLSERLSRILNVDFGAESVVHSRRFSPGRIVAGLVLALSLAALVLPAGKGFLKTTPWRCPHTGPASCCATDAPGGHHSHCRS